MPIQFLVPLFLAGLAALAIPIIVHLTRKQRAKVVPFPSLMFLEKVPFHAESRRKIHHWLLLAARALAVILIVAAFARPFFQDADLAAAAGSGPTEVVVLLDRSYSMGVGDHWSRALDAVRDAVRGMGPLDRASLVTFARSAEVVVRSSADRSRVTGALDTLAVSDQATSYGPALKLAQTLLEESELPGKSLFLIGDFQRTGWTGEEGVALPEGTVVTPVPLAEEQPENRAVATVSLPRQRFSGRDRITPTARITRIGGAEPEDAEVVLEVDGREVQRSTVTLPTEGAATVTFQPFTLADRHTRGSVRLVDDDALAPDDAYYFVSSPGRALPVMIVEDPANRGASSLYLRQALSISEENAFDVSVRATGSLGAGELEGIGVLIVNDRPVAAGGTASAIRDFVQEGGGLVVVLGERISWPSELGDLLPGVFTGPTDREEGRGGRLGHLEYDHPVFEVFRGPRSGDFTGARFFRARGLTVAESDSTRVLARYDDGSVALAEKWVGDGRVLVWTSTLDAFWNDLAVQPVFLPFVHQLVRYASGRSETLSSFQAGQVLDVTDARAMETAGLGEAVEAIAGGELVTVTPDGETVSLPAGDGPRFLRLEEQGFYELRPPGNENVRPLAVAVNVEADEADLTPLDAQEVVASVTSGPGEAPVRVGENGRTERLRREDQERRQSLWRVLLMGAFALLALETVVSNRVSGAGRKGSHARA